MRRLSWLLASSILAGAISVISGPAPGPAMASEARDLCSGIGTVIGHSDSRFEGIAGEPGGASGGTPGERIATFALPEASRCVVSAQPGRGAYLCRWDFPYRDQRATERFETLAADLRRCIGHMAEEQLDRAVNHPDTYVSRRYDLARGTVSLSIKDKVARGGTFVSIRVESAAKPE